jgi:predicted RNA binding protein YcfA (HicA-like mRNA interferase family)
MLKLPNISGKKLISLLEKIGFEVIRIRGSHHFIKHKDGRVTVIPVHANEDLGPGILTKIIKDIELKKEDILKLLS